MSQRKTRRPVTVFALALVVSLLLPATLLANTTINFSETSGYGMDADHVMVEDIRVDTEITNPFDPTRPEIVSNYYNVPFVFDPATLHLVPDLTGAVVADPEAGCATLEVFVTDASNGAPLAGALVEIGNSSAYSNNDGYVAFSGLTSGSALLEGSAFGYVATSRQMTLSCSVLNSVGMALSPVGSGSGGVSAGGVRIILTWGEDPRDLDSHLTGPNSSGVFADPNDRFHVYYANRTSDVAVLDVDDTTSFGPETITIEPPDGSSVLRPGLYRYSVHHYAGASTISGSNAAVALQFGDTTYRTYSPPAGGTGSSDVWTVFELSVSDSGTITVYDVNSFSYNTSPSQVQSSPPRYGEVETGVDFIRLPAK